MAIAYLLNYLLFNLISFLYWYFALYKQEKRKSLLLQNEKLKAELLFLKSEVSPHFLFNSLNNIYSLSITKHDNAPLMIAKLSDILRYIIYEGKNKVIPLKREVELLKNYIDLQLLKKPKAEKNIHFAFNGVQSYHKMAPLILINIVENCFKHSNIAYVEIAFLEIALKVKDDKLHFYAANSFIANSKKSGVGLDNIKLQLKHHYPDKHIFEIYNNGGIFKVKLQLNLNQ